MAEFAVREDMVDLVFRDNGDFRQRVEARAEVQLGKRLEGGFAVVYMPPALVDELTNPAGGYPVHQTLLGLLGDPPASDPPGVDMTAALEAAGIAAAWEEPLALRGRGVVLGVVDTGVAWGLPAFRRADGRSRVAYLWDQTLAGGDPPGYPFGAEFTGEELDAMTPSAPGVSGVPGGDGSGHGTFLAALMAAAAPEAELIAVKLRPAKAYHRERLGVPPWQADAYSSADAMLGVQYVLDRARALGRPAALCFALGSHIGSHAGTGMLAEYLSRAAGRTGVAVAAAAGNEALARHHASGIVEAGGVAPLELIIEARAGVSPQVQLYLYSRSPDRLSIGVTSPAGERVERFALRSGEERETPLVLERARVAVTGYYPLPASGNQLTWLRIRDGTPGVWTVEIHGDAVVNGEWQAWLPVTGLTEPGVVFAAPDPHRTVTIPATAAGTLTVGAYDALTGALYAASSWGPTNLPRSAPDLAAPGVAVAGVFPLGGGIMSGTGVAAAIGAGACALLLEWGVLRGREPGMNGYLARSYLLAGCARDPRVQYPNSQWGYGRLDAAGAVAAAEGR